jgi:hypothetical protein
MSNEQFLIVSYFAVAAIVLLIGFGAYVWLRAPLRDIAAALPWEGMKALLKRLFPLGLFLPALFGFISVSYRGCPEKQYDEIVADRSYVIGKSREQIGESLLHVAWAIAAWCLLIAILMAVQRRRDTKRGDDRDAAAAKP